MKSILDSISGVEALQILNTLCSSDTELRKRIESEAEKLLCAVDPEEVASEVLFELEGIDVEELCNRSGPSRHGYSSPDEMAVEMIEEVLKPFEDKIQELIRNGMPLHASETATPAPPLPSAKKHPECIGPLREKPTPSNATACRSRANCGEAGHV